MITAEGPLRGEQRGGGSRGGGVIAFAALKVLEMICDLLPACACSRGPRRVGAELWGEGEGGVGGGGGNDRRKCGFFVAVGSDLSARRGREGWSGRRNNRGIISFERR